MNVSHCCRQIIAAEKQSSGRLERKHKGIPGGGKERPGTGTRRGHFRIQPTSRRERQRQGQRELRVAFTSFNHIEKRSSVDA
jgi:hypothetical protein